MLAVFHRADKAEINISASFLTGFDVQDKPVVEFQEYSSIVTLRDHQTLHIGTIDRKTAVNYRRGVPRLRAIPGLKYFFSVSGRKTETSKLYIVAKPCFCNSMLYGAKMKGDPESILKVRSSDYEHPQFIERDFLPHE